MKPGSMKLGIIEVGRVPDSLKTDYVPYPEMFRDLLTPHFAPLTVTVYDALAGNVPTDPKPEDGWLITGSPAGAYEDHVWIPPLEAFIRSAHTQKTPLVGVCFGHQIIAQALGGRVEKSEKGWGIGPHTYALSGPEQQAQTLTLNAMHQDQVVRPPAEANIWLSSDFCPYAGLAIGSHILTVQPHPEFSPDYEAALITARRGTLIPESLAESALSTLAGLTNLPGAQTVAHRLAHVLKQNTAL